MQQNWGHLLNVGIDATSTGTSSGGDFSISHTTSGTDRLMLVGHLPFLERLAGLLLVGDPERRIYRMQNAGILALERDDEGGWSIRWAVTPNLD